MVWISMGYDSYLRFRRYNFDNGKVSCKPYQKERLKMRDYAIIEKEAFIA